MFQLKGVEIIIFAFNILCICVWLVEFKVLIARLGIIDEVIV